MSMRTITRDTKSFKELIEFVAYCADHPEHRFWQALRNWSGYGFVLVTNVPPYKLPSDFPIQDTFYFEQRRHDQES